MRRLAAHTWLIILVPYIMIIWWSSHTGKPLNLLKDTEVDYVDRDTVLAMHLLSEGEERAKTIRYMAAVDDKSRVLLYLQKDSLDMPVMGDILMVQTTIKRGGILGDFDYGTYLRRQGIVGNGWASRRNWTVIGHEEQKGLQASAKRCQYALNNRYKQLGIDGKRIRNHFRSHIRLSRRFR